MNQPLLILDVHYLCHRAYHTTAGSLSYEGRATGVVFGFLKSITQMKDEFATDRVVFCFEGRDLHRKTHYPDYKNRNAYKEKPPDEQKAYESLAIQISALHYRYLPAIGFRNVFCFDGFESDDVMAKLAYSAGHEDEVIIVTADGDLMQCLRHNVSIWNPQKGKMLTEQWFRKEYGIAPRKWALVKALAGCHSDHVKGITGIGEKTALRFAKHELPPETAAYQMIMSAEGKKIVQRNRALVELPYKGCPLPEMQEDNVTRDAWIEVCRKLGMRSIAGRPPLPTRKAA